MYISIRTLKIVRQGFLKSQVICIAKYSVVYLIDINMSPVAQSCPTLCISKDCSLPGSFAYRIFQARILEWGCHFLLQGIFLIQGSSPRLLCLLLWQANSRAFLVAQMVKNPPAMWETWVWSLGWEDLLEKGTPVFWRELHSSILAWRIPWSKEPGRLESMGSRVGHNWATSTFSATYTQEITYICSPKVMYKNIYSSSIHNRPELETP